MVNKFTSEDKKILNKEVIKDEIISLIFQINGSSILKEEEELIINVNVAADSDGENHILEIRLSNSILEHNIINFFNIQLANLVNFGNSYLYVEELENCILILNKKVNIFY